MRLKLSWLWLLIGILYSISTMGQDVIDNQIHTCHFKPGKYNFDPSFRDNAATMDKIVYLIDSFSTNPHTAIRSIKISTSTSPEGGKKLNVKLASDRSHSIVNYLVNKYPGLTQQIVISSELAPDWKMLREKVYNGNMKQRTAALKILDTYADYYNPDFSVIDPREEQLFKLDHGWAWRYMLDNYFSDMRYAKVELLHELADTSNVFIEQVVPAKEEVIPEPEPVVEEEVVPEPEPEPEPEPVVEIPEPKPSKKWLIALKTNLLFDLVGALNGEIEVPIKEHWSVQGEVVWPWWVHSRDSWCEQMGLADGEVRYWLGTTPLQGHFFGLTGGWGYYDFETNNKGYQGELWMAGLTYGYSIPLSKIFNMEFSLGAGYMYTNYRRYHAHKVDSEKYLVKKYSEHRDWVGPLKAKVSFVWLLFNKK